LRLWLAAVGKLRAGPLYDVYSEYAKRIAPPVQLKEVEVRQRLPDAALAVREGELLLAAIPPASTIVVLDERGIELPSADFAAKIAGWRDAGQDVYIYCDNDAKVRAPYDAMGLMQRLGLNGDHG